jgi:hypothetical protein
MKKLALATAIAAAATGAHASTAQLELYNVAPGVDAVVACYGPFSTAGLTVTGTAMTGDLCMDPSYGIGQPNVALTFNLSGSTSGGATTYTAGAIDIWTDWGTTSGWLYYGAISAATTPINCLDMTSPPGLMPATPSCTATLLNNAANIYIQ